jgi:hypothetical protein
MKSIRRCFILFGLVGVLAACSAPAYFRLTGRLLPAHVLYLICPPAIVALGNPSDWWDKVLMWSIVLLGNALIYGGLAAVIRLSIDSGRSGP